MVKLHFRNTNEFEKLFKVKDKEVTDAIVNGIQTAMQKNKRSADLFEVSFADTEIGYSISLPIAEWPVALQSCLDHYHSSSCTSHRKNTTIQHSYQSHQRCKGFRH